jgi:serine protease Do
VPVDPYRDSWDRLVRGEVWGLLEGENEGWLGVTEDAKSKDARILQVLPDSPAHQAGLKPGDVIQRLADAEIGSFDRLQEEVRRYLPGESVKLKVRRGKNVYELKVQLGRRP